MEKNEVVRGLNFALAPVKLNHGDYLTPFELLFRDVTKIPVPDNISAIYTASYGWAKFFIPLFKCFTINEYTLKDSLEFGKDITN